MFLNGAPEAIAAVLHVEIPPDLANLIAAAASHGERVLMLAEGRSDEGPHIVGLLRLQDPPRPEVPTAVAACLRAGIRVIMFTGDHPATAKGIALRIGLASESTPVIEATTLDAMDDDALLLTLRETAILARTTPEQKLRIVRVLQSDGNIVTVTGDGVNDAPALRRADVGIAMGRGTEIAKQASDVILFDENFATIVAAIEQGRGIKKNIQKFISYVSTSDVAELVPFICYVLLPIPLPLTILQVLAIDLGTDVFPALALGLERPAPRTLDVPPSHQERRCWGGVSPSEPTCSTA
jgi:magnesium-transporting ATPase (P-type)